RALAARPRSHADRRAGSCPARRQAQRPESGVVAAAVRARPSRRAVRAGRAGRQIAAGGELVAETVAFRSGDLTAAVAAGDLAVAGILDPALAARPAPAVAACAIRI